MRKNEREAYWKISVLIFFSHLDGPSGRRVRTHLARHAPGLYRLARALVRVDGQGACRLYAATNHDCLVGNTSDIVGKKEKSLLERQFRCRA